MYFPRLDIHLFTGGEISSIFQQQQFQRCLTEYFLCSLNKNYKSNLAKSTLSCYESFLNDRVGCF